MYVAWLLSPKSKNNRKLVQTVLDPYGLLAVSVLNFSISMRAGTLGFDFTEN